MPKAATALVLVLAALQALQGCTAQDTSNEERDLVVAPSIIRTEALEAHLRQGDVIFRGRDGGWGNLGALVSRRDQRYGHVGVMIGEPGNWDVIHAAGDPATPDGRVRRDPLAVFLSKSTRAGLYRPRLDAAQMDAFASHLLAHAVEGTAFDRDYDLATVDRQYCSELIWRALMAVSGEDPVPDKTTFRGRIVIALDDLQHAELMHEVLHVGEGRERGAKNSVLMTHPQ